jgi:hypothetical protein
LHRPPWHVSVDAQSLSALQPTTHLLLMHQAPWPHSLLYVQLEGRPASAPPVPVPPPVPAEPPPVPLPEPPPVPPLPLPPPAPLTPPSGSGWLDVGVQKFCTQLLPGEQSGSVLQCRQQYPLMHESMPHWLLVEHVCASGGTTWQLPPRQNSPVWQSAFALQVDEQTPFRQALPPVQSAALLQVGKGWHVPLLQPHVLWQSDVWVHVAPGHPALQSPKPLSDCQPSTKQADRARAGRTNNALEVMVWALVF